MVIINIYLKKTYIENIIKRLLVIQTIILFGYKNFIYIKYTLINSALDCF